MNFERLILYAPNIHIGGGLILLQALLSSWPATRQLIAFLDERASGVLTLPTNLVVIWVRAALHSRLQAEFKLSQVCNVVDTVFCLNSLPPTLSVRGKVIVFHQNRILLGFDSLRQFPLRVALRVSVERLIARFFRHRVDEYIVQTSTMAQNLTRWYAGNRPSITPLIRIQPFGVEPISRRKAIAPKKWDFIYVADGMVHKNHARLLEAWRNLATQGIRPILALTLRSGDAVAIAALNAFKAEGHSNVVNLGQLSHHELLASYEQASALIFPSLSESFGLPLIEAKSYGLPIIASELDFVRDVCLPEQTFDPYSDRSISRAVKRHLGLSDDIIKLRNATEFWSDFFNDQHLAKFKDKL
jgi:glycosyltransferase involved in cell wall biosynthesis